MKISLVQIIIFLYIGCLLCGTIAEKSNQMTSARVAELQGLMQPTGTDQSALNSDSGGSFITAGASLITNVWSYLKTFIQITFLWFPSLWSGSWLWFYFCFPLELAIGMIISVVVMLRGVHSN